MDDVVELIGLFFLMVHLGERVLLKDQDKDSSGARIEKQRLAGRAVNRVMSLPPEMVCLARRFFSKEGSDSRCLTVML